MSIRSYRIPKKSIRNAHLNLSVPIQVSTVAELEKALENQTADQVIEVFPGDYVLTKSISIPVAAQGGVLRCIGERNMDRAAQITGAVDADEAILIKPAASSASWYYTFEGVSVRAGAADKIGIRVNNADIGKKIVLNFRNCYVDDKDGSVGLKIEHPLDSQAIRIFAYGGSWGGQVDFTANNDGDRFFAEGVWLEKGVVTAGGVCAEFRYKSCILLHEGQTGGNALHKINVLNCYVYTDTGVARAMAKADANDFPAPQSPTILD